MPRAIWSGTISFGLVSIPVKLFNAVSRKSVSFNQLDARSGARVRQKLVSGTDGSDVPRDDIVKGYNVGGDQYVTVSEDELSQLMPQAQRTIDLEEFVSLDDIDPVFYDSAYYLVPEKAAVKPYALLTAAMEGSDKVGIGRFVMRSKEYVAALRPRGGKLVLSTMVYADELNDVDEFPEIEAAASAKLSDKEIAMATQLVESLSADFDPEKYHDTYREHLLDLIERKAAGEVQEAPAPVAAEDSRVVDLLAALEASVAAAKESRQRHPTALPADDAAGGADDEVEDDAPAAKKPAARARSRRTA
jgi:DNA end-binding protein Ku